MALFRRFFESVRSSETVRARLAVGAAVIIVVVAAVIGLIVSGGGSGGPKVSAPTQAPPLTSNPPVTGSPSPPPTSGGSTLLAVVSQSAPRYSEPGGRADGTVPASWYERPSVLPVIATRPGWVHVRLAQRPNDSTAWVRSSDVMFASTPYKIVINLKTLHLSLYRDGRQVLDTPAGVGAVVDPTPTGQFFIAFREAPPSPGYGAFVLVTSAHSPKIADWDGSGDAVIGIHGPLGMDTAIGTTGARISHGCIRLHEQALLKLQSVPPGTPVDVIN